MSSAGAIATSRCRSASAGARCPTSARSISSATPCPSGRWLAPTLVGAMHDTLGRGEQALLFLNRRGYAPLTLCRACGHRYECPNCSAWLVEHRFRRALVCHHCGHVERRPQACVACGSLDSLVPCGPGVERIAEEVAELCSRTSADRPVERFSRRHGAAARGARGDRRGRVRHRHRHAARGQGTQLPAHDPGRRARRRYRPDLRRSARGRADLPAPAAGDRPGRARRQAGPGPRSRPTSRTTR